MTGQVILRRPRKTKKGKVSTLTTATTSFHLPKLVSADLTIKLDSVLTNPIERYPIRYFYCDTITRRAENPNRESYLGDFNRSQADNYFVYKQTLDQFG